MSQENVKIVWRIHEAFNQGNLALPELIDQDFDRIPDERFTLTAGPIRGRENVQRYLEGLIEAMHFQGAGGTIRPWGPSPGFRTCSRPRDASGVELDVRNAALWTLRTGEP